MSIAMRSKHVTQCLRSTHIPRSTASTQTPHLNITRGLSTAILSQSPAIKSLRTPLTGAKLPSLTNQPRALNQIKPYSTNVTPTADALIEEIQDAYEIAKDEFEIATESTDGGTIYAASDRDSARDALNELCAIFYLYAAKPGEEETGILLRSGETVSGSQLSGAGKLGEEGPTLDLVTTFKTEDVPQEVKDEVRRRIAQRIRELRSAVELLEERATEE